MGGSVGQKRLKTPWVFKTFLRGLFVNVNGAGLMGGRKGGPWAPCAAQPRGLGAEPGLWEPRPSSEDDAVSETAAVSHGGSVP